MKRAVAPTGGEGWSKLERGLLITESEGTRSDSCREATGRNHRTVDRCLAAGGLFAVAAGGNEEAGASPTRAREINAPAILPKAAEIIEPRLGRTPAKYHLPPNVAVLAAILAGQFGVHLILYMGGRTYVPRVDGTIRAYMAKCRVACVNWYPFSTASLLTSCPRSWRPSGIALLWIASRRSSASGCRPSPSAGPNTPASRFCRRVKQEEPPSLLSVSCWASGPSKA